ncbi:S-adenosyl-l-methionine hydroxide adenosyltransferase family protein, partial [Patescibacteria group bacterium]
HKIIFMPAKKKTAKKPTAKKPTAKKTIRRSKPGPKGHELRSVVDIERQKMPLMGATIVTDFQESLATGQMVGMILSHHAATNVHVITDDIDPFNIIEGGFAIREVVRYYPTPYVHIGVIDPGVGTDRNSVAIRLKHQKTGGNVYLIGPDNGLFYPTMLENEVTGVVTLRAEEGPSSTFHGRDVFARHAGRLVAGMPFEKLGEKMDPDNLIDLDVSPNTFVHRDGFGNLKSLIHSLEGLEIGKKYILQVPTGVYEFTMVRTFDDVDHGTLVGYMGSWGTLEIAVVQGDAAKTIGARAGDQFWINLSEKL